MRAAREEAGLTAAEAARRAGISAAYLRQVEREGATYGLACRLARLYGCAMDVFLPKRPWQRNRKPRQRPRGKGAART